MKRHQRQRGRRRAAGFTLIEIMVVVVIMGLLAGVITVAVMRNVDKARLQTAATQLGALGQALDSFKLDCGFYPSTEQGLDALINRPSVGRQCKNWQEGGYLQRRQLPLDPWSNNYQYLSPGTNNSTSYDIWSMGPDGQDGSGDEITNWGGGAKEQQ